MSDLPTADTTVDGGPGVVAGRRVDHGPYRAVALRVQDQARRTPGRPAAVYRGTVLDYRAVDGLANGLAAALAAAGVRRGALVPVNLVNGLELPLAMLALHKLGAAFVLCDPAWPADRMKSALASLDPALMLGADHPGAAGIPVVPVSAAAIVPAGHGPGVEPGPDEPAYGVFTSGTTGTPKCAVNVHRGLANRLNFMTRYFGADGTEVVLQNSRHTFDSAIWQLLWPLTTGGCTVIPEQGDFLDLERTVDIIAAHRVTVTDFVPATLGTLVSLVEADPAALDRVRSLRHLVVGGEEVGPSAVHRLRALVPGLRVSNGYGPSEASIGMVFHPITAGDGDHVPLGRPIDNCYAVVVDVADSGAGSPAAAPGGLRPLPPGEIGEIVIGGACVGAGYHGEPELTAAVFVDNPFPEIPGPRVYRTGDLGWFDELGLLRFSGRKDRQIKVNGVRIELGEVEAAAAGCPGVSHAKALAVRRDGRTRLAVAVAGPAGTVDAAGVRAHLAAKLPRTSLPQHILVLPALPLTDNGKVDLRALQAGVEAELRDADAAEPADDLLDAAAPAEQRIARILRDVLNTAEFGADEDFLARGGDSLRAMTAVLRLRAVFGAAVGVQDLYERRTAAALAPLLATAVEADTEESDESLMERDALLAADIAAPPPGAVPRVPPRTVLVTGATGFIGSRAVLHLLRDTATTVACVVRGADDDQARARLMGTLRQIDPTVDFDGGRLAVYAGDLGRPRLGLTRGLWADLADDCDAVLHIGALVNLLFDYRAHRAANVLGTLEVLRLCATGRIKALHHISTLGALDRHAAEVVAAGGAPVGELCDVPSALPPLGGYSRSKWVAERLVLDAGRRGVPAAVYRLGEVMPAEDNGLPNPRALTHLLLTAFHELGLRPDVPMRTDYTPVDQVADRLVAALAEPPEPGGGRILHLFHGESVSLPDLAPELPAVPEDRFREALAARGREFDVLLALPAGLDRVLTDNPALFDRGGAAGFDLRHGLADRPLGPSIAAYHRRIHGARAPRGPQGG
jgi:amino acid adenylation domain-containing protein/thioester reductase-like protein